MEGTGLLTINESCSIFNANFRIASQSVSVLNRKNEYLASSFVPIRSNSDKINKYIIDKSDLTDINKKFEAIKEKLKYEEIVQEYKIAEKRNRFIFTEKIHTGLNISTTILILIIVLFCIYFYKKNLVGKPQKEEIEFEWVSK